MVKKNLEMSSFILNGSNLTGMGSPFDAGSVTGRLPFDAGSVTGKLPSVLFNEQEKKLRSGGRLPVIFVSGFMPFGGRKKNASKTILDGIIDKFPSIEHKILSVVPGETAANVDSMIKSKNIDIWIAFGEDANQHHFQVEVTGKPTDTYAPFGATVFSNNNDFCRKLSDHLNYKGFKTIVDGDAGNFVCNEVLYACLSNSEKLPLSVFIHTPIETDDELFNGDMVFGEKRLKEFGQEVIRKVIELYKENKLKK